MTDARKLWTQGSTAPVLVDPKEVAERAVAFRRKVRWSNLLEYVAGVFVIGVFTLCACLPDFVNLPPVSRIGAALIALGGVFVLTYLALRGTPANVRPEVSTLAWHRAELERRHALVSSVVRWYLAPFWPGTAIFVAGIAVHKAGRAGATRSAVMVILFMVATNALIVWVNRRAARKLAAEIEALPRD